MNGSGVGVEHQESDAAGGEAVDQGDFPHTVVALFDDGLDAEQAMVALRKGDHRADRVSLLVRDQAGEGPGQAERAGAVARAVVASALEMVGSWLHGLASLIVPERGTFLVAGPIGAALAGISTAADTDGVEPGGASATGLDADSLQRTLAEFGFASEEAAYLEQRLLAGATLVALTAADEKGLQATRRLLADHDAVHIGAARTDPRFLLAAETLLAAAPEDSSGGDVVVADSVAPLRRVSDDAGSPEAVALRKRAVVDSEGQQVGDVDDVLFDVVDPDGSEGPLPAKPEVRYLVIGHGGLLGLGRRRFAVPVAIADHSGEPIRLAVAKAILERAPAYDDDAPFSRTEEQAVHLHFGVEPYWQQT